MRETKSNHQTEQTPNGTVYLVGAGPGDPGLLTLKGLECLQKADVVVHDRLVNPKLLEYASQAELIDVGKQPDHHPVPQENINAILVEKANEGKAIVRLKGGDPFVFGRGGEEAAVMAEAGIPFEIIPGVTSATAVPAYAGIPVTHRGVASSVAFVTGHGASSEMLDINWKALARGVDTLVFLMGVNNLPTIITTLSEAGLPSKTPVALIEHGTTPDQKVVVGTLADILEKADEIQAPAIIIIGEVVGLRPALEWFKPNHASIPDMTTHEKTQG